MVAGGRPTMRTGVNGSGDRRGAAGTRTHTYSVRVALCAFAGFALASSCHPTSAQTWDKVKEDLASRGIMPSVVYDGNLLTDAAGGLKRDSIFQGNFYAQLRIDSEKAFGFPGLKLFFQQTRHARSEPRRRARRRRARRQQRDSTAGLSHLRKLGAIQPSR
jgi:hypothetical protein